ncbi:hypothetical protein IWQ60_008727 [Tieghemiomyces parasiticus]|uniref:3-oxo-5-alpha-steroid 4-dehydrogenase C-terminal domain-containing protein n=1 Tax=Tieghemiomyces parasiticus TaxID=78921 RepID=A0A9W7ZXF7_9FUNG|nr:hypothetical protein IWQ60_008727 [Tieghemiomyces parasiticus]
MTVSTGAYGTLLVAHVLFSLLTTPVVFWVGSPYGKLTDAFRARAPTFLVGTSVPGKAGWVVMETAALVTYWWTWLRSAPAVPSGWAWLYAALWTVHYVNRAWIYPWRSPSRSPMGLTVVLAAVVFNVINGFVNGAWAGACTSRPPVFSFLLGLALFIAGFLNNVWADERLMALRRIPDGPRYRIPYGGGFAWVSSPHYLAELLEWTGYAMATGALPAWLFVASTAANLVPRAQHAHRWYRRQFPDYPADRQAIIPYLY